MTDTSFEAVNREVLVKLTFLFGDKVLSLDEILFEEESKWLHKVGNLLMFFPDMERSYPLAYLQRLLASRQLDWDITQKHDGVIVRKFGTRGLY